MKKVWLLGVLLIAGCATSTEPDPNIGCHPFQVWTYNAEHTDSVLVNGCYCVKYNWDKSPPPAKCTAALGLVSFLAEVEMRVIVTKHRYVGN